MREAPSSFDPSKGAQVIQVIRTTFESRGAGIPGDPCRRVVQYWSLDGELLAEVDPCAAERGAAFVAHLREQVR